MNIRNFIIVIRMEKVYNIGLQEGLLVMLLSMNSPKRSNPNGVKGLIGS